MDETEELIALMARASVAQMAHAPGFELHMTRGCMLSLTGEPLVDFNTACIGPGPDGAAFLVRAVTRARTRGLPLMVVMTPQVAEALAPVATGLGLTAAGTSPLMVLHTGPPAQPGPSVRVVRALGQELVGIAGDLVAAAFDAPRDAVARGIDAALTESAGMEAWIAFADDAPVSVVSAAPAGSTAGVFGMGTPPEHRRQGFGRALLAQMMDHYRRRGVARFYLVATEAGRPLYTSLGFEVVAELTAWVLEA